MYTFTSITEVTIANQQQQSICILIYQLVQMFFFCLGFQMEEKSGKFNTGSSALIQGTLRNLLAPRVYTLPMVRAIGRTMVQGKNYGPQITVKRLATRLVDSCTFDFTICG